MSSDIDDIRRELMKNFEALAQINFNAVNNYHTKLEMIDNQIKTLQEEQNKLIEEFCALCTHPKEFLALADYKSSTFFDFMPIRICKLCGGIEEGWNYHFIVPKDKNGKLTWISDSDLPKVDRDELFKLRRKTFKLAD